jgi:hypothetical protein
MLTMVAVLPQPPLLVPELAAGAASETAELREACVVAASRLASSASCWVAVGSDLGGRRTVGPEARGTFAGYGVDLTVALDTRPAAGPPGPADPNLPLPLLVAGWVAGRTGAPVRVRGELVAPDADRGTCADLGAALAAECAGTDQPVGLLVVGDGAATHTEKAPGYLDDRAGAFDDAVATALDTADPTVLAGLDPVLGTELMAAGRAPWQVLAAVAAGRRWDGELLYSAAPFGVAYHVAVWTPAPTAGR